MADLTHLSLFSGIGGLDLAAEWAGFRTVGQCEWADYPRAVLEKHWPGLPRWRDIRTLTGDDFYSKTGYRTVTVVSGGFPCQPFSTAGKRRGKDDDRYLWPEMLRVISEIRPAWVVGENVAGIVSMALDTVLSDLESIGYTTQAFVIPACAVDAPHRRDRVAIVANASIRETGPGNEQKPRIKAFSQLDAGGTDQIRDVAHTKGKRCREEGKCFGRPAQRSAWSCQDVAYTDSGTVRYDGKNRRTSDRDVNEAVHTGLFGGTEKAASNADFIRLEEQRLQGLSEEQGVAASDHGWWPVEPDVGRVAHGVPSRVDRLKCLGNAVVPQQFYPVFQAIADIERTME